jgi:hypothetical protein
MNISGRLTANATVSTTTTGKEVVNFSVAVNDGYKTDKGNGWTTPYLLNVPTGVTQSQFLGSKGVICRTNRADQRKGVDWKRRHPKSRAELPHLQYQTCIGNSIGKRFRTSQ